MYLSDILEIVVGLMKRASEMYDDGTSFDRRYITANLFANIIFSVRVKKSFKNNLAHDFFADFSRAILNSF